METGPIKAPLVELFDVTDTLLAVPFARQSFFGAAFFARLEIEGVLLDLLDDIFLLDLTLEAAECGFECLAILQYDFSQLKSPASQALSSSRITRGCET